MLDDDFLSKIYMKNVQIVHASKARMLSSRHWKNEATFFLLCYWKKMPLRDYWRCDDMLNYYNSNYFVVFQNVITYFSFEMVSNCDSQFDRMMGRLLFFHFSRVHSLLHEEKKNCTFITITEIYTLNSYNVDTKTNQNIIMLIN